MNEYLISSYQIVFPNGVRDNIKPLEAIKTDDVEKSREELKVLHGCQTVNLTYTIIPNK